MFLIFREIRSTQLPPTDPRQATAGSPAHSSLETGLSLDRPSSRVSAERLFRVASKVRFATCGKLPCTKRQEARHHLRNVIAIVVAALRSRRWTVALVSTVVILCTPLGAVAAKPKQVLLLHSFGRDFAPYDAIVAAFRTELATGWREPLAVYDATLDAEQVSESDDPNPSLNCCVIALPVRRQMWWSQLGPLRPVSI